MIFLKKLLAFSKAIIWWLSPFAVVLGLYLFFLLGSIPGLPTDLAERGQFGDSFGTLNTLFTGLGFAGLLLTIALQQRQLSRQARDFQAQLHDAAVRRYEDNLYRLLGLYKEAVEAVIGTRDGRTSRGHEVLRQATDSLLKTIRQEKVNSIPHDIQKRFQSGQPSQEDRDVIDYLYYRNFWHINYGLTRQGRLLQTFMALLRHLESSAPKETDVEPYRKIVLSQITHIEVSYFFFVALGFREEEELRYLMAKSGLLKRVSSVYKLQIHRFMYLEYWKHDLRRDKKSALLPIAAGRIKKVMRQEKMIRSRLMYLSPSTETVDEG